MNENGNCGSAVQENWVSLREPADMTAEQLARCTTKRIYVADAEERIAQANAAL